MIEVEAVTGQRFTYTWAVRYTGGCEVSEYDEDRPDGRGWAEIDESRVKEVALLPVENSREQAHIVALPDGATPVFFRRHTVVINLTDESRERLPTRHCIGWKRESEAVYLFVYDDGSTFLTDDLQAG